MSAAGTLAAREGYDGLSIRGIATAAGCSTGTVTYYFASKGDVVAALAEEIFDVADIWPQRAKASPEIDQVIAHMLRTAMTLEGRAWSIWFHLLVHAARNPKLSGLIRRRFEHFRTALAEAMRLGQVNGRIRVDVEPDLLADQITAMADGWMMMAPIESKRFASARRDALVATVLTMIKR